MKRYKEILYKYLFNYLESFDDKTIIVDWALILNDNLQDRFDKIIYVDSSEEIRLERLSESDLSKEDILKRFALQKIDFYVQKAGNNLDDEERKVFYKVLSTIASNLEDICKEETNK